MFKNYKKHVFACVHTECMCVCDLMIYFLFVESNILVLQACGCPIIWECSCQVKYLVKLADVDSIKETLEQVDHRTVPVVGCSVKNSTDYSYLAGTKGY